MAYVIIGATGHIGNNIVRQLVNQQKEVKVIVRKIDKSIANLPITYLIGDVFNKEFLEKCIDSEDVVMHFAGIIDIKNNQKEATYNINYLGTIKITDVCLEKRVKKYIYCSSVDAIYKPTINEVISEPTKMEIDKFKQNYPKSKALATQYVMSIMNDNPSFNVAIIYPSAVIGVNDWKPSYVGKVIQDCLLGKVEFGIRGGYNFVDVDDLALATINLADNNQRGNYIFSGHNVTVFELYETINKMIGKKRFIWHVPMFIVHLAIPFVPYLSRFMLGVILENHNYDSSKAQKDLGFELTPFEVTIRKTIDWFANNNLPIKKNKNK